MSKRPHSKISVASYDEFLRELGSEVNTNKRFKHIQYNQSFALENLASVEDPTELLRYCFQQCIDRTMAKSRQEGMECDQLGVTISSPLLSYDIWTPLRPITDNTVDAILNTFLKVMQSQTAEGIYGEPFTVTVTGVRAQDLPTRRTTVGRGRKNYVQNIVRNIEDACILQIKNTDRYCLFYALELMRIHVSNEMTRQRFFEYKTKIGGGVHGRDTCSTSNSLTFYVGKVVETLQCGSRIITVTRFGCSWPNVLVLAARTGHIFRYIFRFDTPWERRRSCCGSGF